MTTFVVLRLKELLALRGMTQATLASKTNINPHRISRLCSNQWEQITRRELEAFLETLETTPAELFGVHQASVFFGARWAGPLTIHVSARTHVPQGKAWDPSDTASFNHRNIQAYKIIHDHARSLGIEVNFEPHDPEPMSREDYATATRFGSHIIIGSNRNGQFCEYAITDMYGTTAFDSDALDDFPFNFAWGPEYSVGSSFGFDAAGRDLELGIYSTRENRIVANRRQRDTGMGLDCGLIAVTRIEEAQGDEESGLRRERCVIVVAGHGRHGTLGCAQALIAPENQARLYPEKSGCARMFAVQSRYLRPGSPEQGGRHCSEMGDAEIVAEG